MKHLSGLWHKLTVVVAVVASLSSCNRAEYAMLPKTTSYHGTERVVARPQPKSTSVAESVAAPVAETPASTTEPATVAPTTVASAPSAVPEAAVSAPKATKPATVAARKTPNFMENAMLKKVTKKAEKIADKILVKQNKEIAGTSDANAITGYLRTGIILLLVGLLITIIPGDIFKLIGGIVSIIGIIFIVLWLLDNL
ncbi:hypothetical protein ACW9KT_05715 [Hymenobacter sp. HD11105]